MPYLDSTSTLADALAAYYDNQTYRVEGDTTKAKYFEVACRHLLRAIPAETDIGGERVKESPDQIRQDLNEVVAWLNANDTSATQVNRQYVRYANLQNAR